MGHLGILNFLVKFPSGREGTVLWEGVHWLQQKSDIGKERGRGSDTHTRIHEDTWLSGQVVKSLKNIPGPGGRKRSDSASLISITY